MVSFANNLWDSLRPKEPAIPFTAPETLAFIERRREAHSMAGTWLESVLRRAWTECPLGRVMRDLKSHFDALWDDYAFTKTLDNKSWMLELVLILTREKPAKFDKWVRQVASAVTSPIPMLARASKETALRKLPEKRAAHWRGCVEEHVRRCNMERQAAQIVESLLQAREHYEALAAMWTDLHLKVREFRAYVCSDFDSPFVLEKEVQSSFYLQTAQKFHTAGTEFMTLVVNHALPPCTEYFMNHWNGPLFEILTGVYKELAWEGVRLESMDSDTHPDTAFPDAAFAWMNQTFLAMAAEEMEPAALETMTLELRRFGLLTVQGVTDTCP